MTGPAPAPTVLLDLDGTLVDSAAGILGSLRVAFDEVGVPWPESGIGREILGPPMYLSLPGIVGEEAAAAILPVYRRVYREHGLLQSPPFDGVPALLAALAAAGARLAVATSKAEPFAERIVAANGWSELFTTVCGDTLDAGRPSKAAVVEETLRRLGGGGSPVIPAVMVGDRSHDVVGARAHGLECLGAGWGYADPGELESAGAAAVFASPDELAVALRGA
ncbi:MAG TPA: HAD hydrolase-like protein [Pseudonocardia sp.]|nr:HAD hydrolase-like protein [Pseudonocardia sp.]